MTVRNLINRLLDMPMDAEVQIAYVDDDFDYKYQDTTVVVKYDDDN